jgi:hypothetical protein
MVERVSGFTSEPSHSRVLPLASEPAPVVSAEVHE